MEAATAADIDMRAARLADPGVDLASKHQIACELREMVDTVHDGMRAFAQLVPVIIDILRSGDPAFNKKDQQQEYAFRRYLLDIVIRCPPNVHINAVPIFSGLLYVLRHDNEENGAQACKMILELIRAHRNCPDDVLSEFMSIFAAVLSNARAVVAELLPVSPHEDGVLLKSINSFKVCIEMAQACLTFLGMSFLNREIVTGGFQSSLPLVLDFLGLQVPQQQRAREAVEANGNTWVGMSPEIKNVPLYADLITAQLKVMHFTMTALRPSPELYEANGDSLILSTLRIMQDCPDHITQSKRDCVLLFRALLPTPFRRALVPLLDKVFNVRIFCGTSAACRETVRVFAYAALADLGHHMRANLSPAQTTQVVLLFGHLLHDMTVPGNILVMIAKAMFSLTDQLVVSEDPRLASRTLSFMFQVFVEKLEALTLLQSPILERIEKTKNNDTQLSGIVLVESNRDDSKPFWISHKPEDFVNDQRIVVRALLHGCRIYLQCLKKFEDPLPDGTLTFRAFVAGIKCLCLFEEVDVQGREHTELTESLAALLAELNAYVFQELWTSKIDFFFEHAKKWPALCQICAILFHKESTSPALTSIVLRYLVDRLPMLGNESDNGAMVTIRLYKLAFQAVTSFPTANEPLLAAHLGKLIMDCFPLAAKSAKPTHYFLLMRGLFRAIGGGGGKFEHLYNEVLPLLPEMLECLNRHLHASEGTTRDMIVELCLTVPLRLTHLLPHLTYLMQPLALALRGAPGSDLVTQGLRTLELCIDNLTPDFLDPNLNIVLRELMEALHTHLKPLPANHIQAHTTIRILGKLGGRNRKLLYRPPSLKSRPYGYDAKMPISFGGVQKELSLAPIAALASREMGKPSASAFRPHAYAYAKNTLAFLMAQGLEGTDELSVFSKCVGTVFEAIHWPDSQEDATAVLLQLSGEIFRIEIRCSLPTLPGARRHITGALSRYLDAMMQAIAREDSEQARKAEALVDTIVHDLIALPEMSEFTAQDVTPILHQIANRFSGLCYDDFWFRKSAGCHGIKMLATIPELGVHWIHEREVDLMRTLLHVLKDLPADLPRDVDEVIDIIMRVLRVGRVEVSTPEAAAAEQARVVYMGGILFTELVNQNSVVRRAAQSGIALLSELTGKPASEIMIPYRERMLTTIFTKPLRALPFKMQIGMLEAIRFCVGLQPPLLEVTEELIRLLHEALALASAEDANLIGQRNDRQRNIDLVNLRVACIQLLTAAMPMTDFFAKQPRTSQQVTSVFFKSLYVPRAEVKEAAHQGLQLVLAHQHKLPKELLQNGLRPILQNLADPKKLSVSGLEGLARLLELLTNYFKVEIGHKLLDHFRVVADPQSLQSSSKTPLAESEGIVLLVRLANVFPLLPSAANMFLENLVNAIVQTEATMHFSSRSPFSEPLGKYLNRYAWEAVEFFLRHVQFPRHVRTLRSILQAKLAPSLQREIEARTPALIARCFHRNEPNLAVSGLQLLSDLAELNPSYLEESPYAVEALVNFWRLEPVASVPSPGAFSETAVRRSLIMRIFMCALEQSPRIDLLFEAVSVFSRAHVTETLQLSHFLYRHVALDSSLLYRRNVLLRFVTWFSDSTYTWADKSNAIRYIITPMLLVHGTKSENVRGLLDTDVVNWMQGHIWNATFADTDDAMKIEVLNMTTVIVQHYSQYVEHIHKNIIKFTWQFMTHGDAIVTQMAYLLAARFFDVFPSPEKFIMRAWTGLLSPPHPEGVLRLVKQTLEVLPPVLMRHEWSEGGMNVWARTTRRLLAEEGAGLMQLTLIFRTIVQHPQLFQPVRMIFVPYMVASLPKMGQAHLATPETRLLSIDVIQVIFDWDCQATGGDSGESGPLALTLRESMVSYLLRLATNPLDAAGRTVLVPRALALLRVLLAPSGWADVSVKLHFFSRHLELADLTNENAIFQLTGAAKVLHVVAAEKPDDWYRAHASILHKLVRKGILTDETSLHDSLHPIFDHLIRLYPLPKEDEDPDSEMADFNAWIYTAIGDGLRGNTGMRGILLMLKSVVAVTPERIEYFSAALVRLASKLTKEHTAPSPSSAAYETSVRHMNIILQIFELGVVHLGDQRRWFLTLLQTLINQSMSLVLCGYMLDLSREWALKKRDAFPTMKEKATILRQMAAFETRGEALFNRYLELIYDIYTDQSLRRSELTTRLEPAFILGCRAKDTALRERFMTLLDASVPRSLFNRLTYVLGVQSWDVVGSHHWIHIALHLLLSAADDVLLARVSPIFLASGATEFRTDSIVRPMKNLLYADPQAVHECWIAIFPVLWSCLSRREQIDITHHMIALLSKDYHIKQAELRPNVIQTLLTGIHGCTPPVLLPPHLVKYLAKNFDAWHISLEILSASLDQLREDESQIRDTIYDSLAEIYAELAEDDLYYGVWRRRCFHAETNVAISYEQHGMWDLALMTYEGALSKSRAGAIAYNEPEYCLWEDHWLLANEKLQHWDLLYDLARTEQNHELLLESAWRVKDWGQHREQLEETINALPEIATPRRRVFEAFVALLKNPSAADKNVEFTRILEDAMQLTLRKWVALPYHLSSAHVPLLQHFQQFVELQEAVQIFGSLSNTNAANLEKKSQDLKMVLQAWRERLPNIEDDISIWSDLVHWRQNVFHAINKAYIPLISTGSQPGAAASGNSETYGYRGYHETAWIINRFAHVARKHDLLDVCFNSLNKIYTLPNIEISEAFLKLREQARCHYQKPNDLSAGLDVINNTNLMYFSATQKAEFFTLKGMFQAKFGHTDEANQAFGQAVQLDMSQAKAWAEWGKYNDRMFKEHPSDLSHAAHAVSCYLQAAGIFKNGKSRPLLARVLWLLSVDDTSLSVSRQFDQYKGDAAWWYWIHMIPQLCLSMMQREVSQARYILLNIAKLFPQALFYQLRTTREETSKMRKRIAQMAAQADATRNPDGDRQMQDVTPSTSSDASMVTDQPSPIRPAVDGAAGPHPGVYPPRQSWDVVEEVAKILKTAFPLLILCLESMVEQLQQRFAPSAEEEGYRLLCMLLQDGTSTLVHTANNPDDSGQLPDTTARNLVQMAANFRGPIRAEFEEDFVNNKPNQTEYIRRLQRWRDRYETYLDSRQRMMAMDGLSHYLTEFQYGKYDEIEVPGQYQLDTDNHTNFVRVLKFDPRFENCRTPNSCCKRITIHGHDNSKTSFLVQLPSTRYSRKEERVMQVFRSFNGHLERRREARKRALQFHLPVAVPCSGNLRLVQNDPAYLALSTVYDRWCKEQSMDREEPILMLCNKVKAVLKQFQEGNGRKPQKNEYFTLKKDLFEEVRMRLVPDDILLNHMTRIMDSPQDLWRIRRQFTLDLAAMSFLSYTFCLSGRVPMRFQVSTATGCLTMNELVPTMAGHAPVFTTNDTVPFRFTPNMQRFVGPVFTEGLLTASIMAIGRCLTAPQHELDHALTLWARDEVMSWFQRADAIIPKVQPYEMNYRNSVAGHIDVIVKRAESMACKLEREQAMSANAVTPNTTGVSNTVVSFISSATNPISLIKMTEPYHPWF